MNREIKFRAWDKESKSFVREVQNDRIPTANTRQGFRLKTRFTLNQYAGFKDRHGVPVYEGDILQWGYRNDSSVFTAKVIFGHHIVGSDSWGIELYTFGFFLQFSDGGVCGIDKIRYKKIGNIYSNPELLHP